MCKLSTRMERFSLAKRGNRYLFFCSIFCSKVSVEDVIHRSLKICHFYENVHCEICHTRFTDSVNSRPPVAVLLPSSREVQRQFRGIPSHSFLCLVNVLPGYLGALFYCPSISGAAGTLVLSSLTMGHVPQGHKGKLRFLELWYNRRINCCSRVFKRPPSINGVFVGRTRCEDAVSTERE